MKPNVQNSFAILVGSLVIVWVFSSGLKAPVKANHVETRAFMNLTQSLERTRLVQKTQNRELVMVLQRKVSDAGYDAVAKQIWEQAKKASKINKDFDNYLNDIQKQLVEAEGSQSYDSGQSAYLASERAILVEADNTRIPSKLLAGNNGLNGGGAELKTRINDTKAVFISLLKGIKGVYEHELKYLKADMPLAADDNATERKAADRQWEHATFNGISVAGALAVLSQIQLDAEITYGLVLRKLIDLVSVGRLEIKERVPVVKLNRSILARGEKLQANVFLCEKVGGINPTIEIDGESIPVSNGVGSYETVAGEQGDFEKRVTMKVPNKKTGRVSEIITSFHYKVFSADASITPLKSNVVYLGLENPIEIAVPGYEPKSIRATLEPASIGQLVPTTYPGQYVAKINRRHKDGCRIVVSVKTSDGQWIPKGSLQLRTMKVPRPYAHLNNKTGGQISSAELKVVRRINATLENFVFEGVRYRITDYKYVYVRKRGSIVKGTANNSSIDAPLAQAFKNAKSGDMFVINDIKASTHGIGTVEVPGALVFNVQ